MKTSRFVPMGSAAALTIALVATGEFLEHRPLPPIAQQHAAPLRIVAQTDPTQTSPPPPDQGTATPTSTPAQSSEIQEEQLEQQQQQQNPQPQPAPAPSGGP